MTSFALIRGLKSISFKDWVLAGGFVILIVFQGTTAYLSMKANIEANTKSILIMESQVEYKNYILLERLDNVEDTLRSDISQLRSVLLNTK